MLAPVCLHSYHTLVEFVGVVFIFLLSLFCRLCWHRYAYAPTILLWNLLVLFSFFSYHCFVDCVGAITCLCSYMILLFNLLAPFWLHTFVNSVPQWIFVPPICTSRGKTYHLSRILEWANTHQSLCKVNGVWTGKKSHYIPVPQLPPLVGYILTIQMHLSIYKSLSGLSSYLYT